MKIQVSKTMLMTLFTGALATLVSPMRASGYTTIEWKGAVMSGVYTDDANWTGDVAPKDGVLGYFNNVTGNPDITLDFSQGISENSSTWMRVPNNPPTATRTITMDASNGGWWEKPAYDYSANAADINYVGPIFGDGNSTPKSTMFSMVRSTTTDFTKTLFKMTNAVVRFGGNKTLMTLEFEGGPIDFWNPAGELEPLESARPSILSGYGSFGPNRITLKAGSSVRTGLWTADANGGDSSIVIEGGDHFFSSWKLLDENATAYRLDVSILGGKVEIGDALVTCAGAKAAKGGQSVGLIVSNAELIVGGAISPACGDVNHRSEILIGGSSVVRAKGLNGKTATSGNSPTGSSSAIEVAGTAKLVVSETPYVGRHPNGVQTVRIAEAGRFECEDGAEALQVGYNANFTSGVTTGILELVDHASCKATECTVGGTAASTQAAYGRVILSDKAAFVVPMTADINVGHKQRVSGKGYFEVLDEAVVTGRYFVVGCAGEGTLALKGGTAAVSKIYGGANGTLIADGGTFDVQASGKTMYGFNTAKLGAKGLVYASANRTTNISQAFEDLDGETDGLFAKTGTGALTVNANSAHAKTEVRGGSLVLDSDITVFGRNLILSEGTTVDASADGLTVDTLTAASGATLKVTAGKPIRVTAVDGLLLGDGVKISLANATTEGTFTLFETETPVTAADLEKIKVVNADYGYIYTLAADGKNVKLVTEYHEPQEVSWNGGVSGGWMTADNWNGGKLPYANDTAIFPAAAETKDVVADGDVRVAALSFPDVATYTLGGTGSVKGDVEVAGGKVSLVAPSVLAGEGELRLKKGTLVGAVGDLSLVRNVVVDANNMPVAMNAEEDMTVSGSLDVRQGQFVKLGCGRLTLNLPAGTHTSCKDQATPNIGNIATTAPDYNEVTGEFGSTGGLSNFTVANGELKLVGEGAEKTIVNNPKVTAIGCRWGGKLVSPQLTLSALTYNGSSSGSRTALGPYCTNAVACPPALVLENGARLNASDLVVAYKTASDGRFYLAVTNSGIRTTGSLQLPSDDGKENDGRRLNVTVDGAESFLEYVGGRDGVEANGIVIGPVNMRLTNGAQIRADVGGLPIVFNNHVRYGASVFVTGGSKVSTPSLLGKNVFQFHSGVTNTFDGGTLELTASRTSLFANPEENVMVVGSNGATVSVGEGLTHRLAFPVVGAGMLVKSGAGTLVLGKTLDWQSDAVTNECEATVLRTTGAVEIAEGALDFAGESVSLVLKPSQGEIRNATLAGVRVDLAGLTPEIGQRIPVVRLGSGVTANLGTWRLATRSPDYSACFVREGDIVVAEIVTKPGLMMIVR